MGQAESREPWPDKSLIYSPLEHSDSIRLIQLQPSKSSNSELFCTITASRLESKPQYEAISYVWGEPTFDETLRTPQGVVKITSSLATALRRFRYEYKQRCLWADAVCINQSDNDEKGVQVGQMGLIFERSMRVLAWLGAGTVDTHQAILDCERLYSVAESLRVEDKDIDFNVFRGPILTTAGGSEEETLTSWDLLLLPGQYDSIRTALKDIKASKLDHLVALPWFGRLWIIQEVATSSCTLLHCGDASVEWRKFASVMRLLVATTSMQGPSLILGVKQEEFMTPDLHRAWNLVQLRNEYQATTIGGLYCISTYRQFGGNLQKAMTHSCSDDRDRIYGLLSLCSDSARSRGVTMKPDYKKQAPEIYRDFALQYLIPSGKTKYPPDARILYDAGLYLRTPKLANEVTPLNADDPNYLPSWVPEYRPRNSSLDDLPWRDTSFNTRWHTCPAQFIRISHEPDFAECSFAHNQNCLGIGGTTVDRIESMIVSGATESASDVEIGNDSAAGPPMVGEQRKWGTISIHDDKISTVWLSTLERKNNWRFMFDALSAARAISECLMQDDKYFTGEDGRAALVRTLFAEYSHPVLSNILWKYPDCKDEAQMIGLWEMFDKCCLQPQGELRTVLDRPESSFRELLETWQKSFEEKREPRVSLFSSDCKDSLDFMMAIEWVLSRCKLIFSTSGMLALVPKAAQQYDWIVQFEGTRMPYVIRPLGKSGLHSLVGPCYVHGIMHSPSVEHDFEITRRGGIICFI